MHECNYRALLKQVRQHLLHIALIWAKIVPKKISKFKWNRLGKLNLWIFFTLAKEILYRQIFNAEDNYIFYQYLDQCMF